jgi:hypothetical protein
MNQHEHFTTQHSICSNEILKIIEITQFDLIILTTYH